MKQKYRAILFDLDNTLADNRASFHKAYIKLCLQYPKIFDPSDRQTEGHLIGLFHDSEASRTSVLEALRCDGKLPEDISAMHFADLWKALYLSATTPYPRAKQILENLQNKKILLGIISNGEGEFQRKKLQYSGLSSYFDLVLISDEVGIEKPDARIYRLALDTLHCTSKEMLFVGDNPDTDILGAHNAGIDSLLVGNYDSNLATYRAADISVLEKMI